MSLDENDPAYRLRRRAQQRALHDQLLNEFGSWPTSQLAGNGYVIGEASEIIEITDCHISNNGNWGIYVTGNSTFTFRDTKPSDEELAARMSQLTADLEAFRNQHPSL